MEISIAGWAVNRSIREQKSLTLMDFPKMAREEFGVDTVELVSTFFESQSARYLNELRQELERQRLKVHNIAVDTGNLSSADETTRRTDIEPIKQWFHVARALGSAAIRVNTGDAQPDDQPAIARIIDGYRELAEHGQQSGVKLLIENHGGASSDPANIKQILDSVNTEWFATCPDVNNFVGETWEEGMRVMAPRAFAVHIKNSSYSPDGWQESQARDGSTRRFNVKECLRILKDAGYKGPLNFEYNLAEQDERVGIRKGIEYTRQMLAAL
jgi:sugar phosphate isomerase/epimerase